MNRTIAVDNKLDNVWNALQAEGYQVVDLEQGLGQAAAVVVSGMDSNVLGDQTITTKAPVIEAAGLSADQVIREVQRAIAVQQ